MLNAQEDSEDCAIFEQPQPPFLLAPEAPEAMLLLLVLSGIATTILHHTSLTHIIGILILVLTVKVTSIMLGQYGLGIFAKIHCAGAVTDCLQMAQGRLQALGEEILAWISGVAPEERIIDIEIGRFTETGKQFQHRAGIIGAIATFMLVYKVVQSLYSKAYSAAKASSSVAELDETAMNRSEKQSMLENDSGARNARNTEEGRSHSNPLLSPDVEVKQEDASIDKNPLKMPDDSHNSCCTACEALENAQAEWTEVVRQHEELNDTLLGENESLRAESKSLHTVIRGLREEIKIQDDRIEYLDVLLEEAGKWLGREVDVKDMLWEAYCKRRKAAGMSDISEEVEMKAEVNNTPEDAEESEDADMAGPPPLGYVENGA